MPNRRGESLGERVSWAKFDDTTDENPKIAPLSDRAFRAYFEGIFYCNRNQTDGILDDRTARKIAGTSKALKELQEFRRSKPEKEPSQCWEPIEGGFRIHDYLIYQPSHKQIQGEKAKKNEDKVRAGKAGAAARWLGSNHGNRSMDEIVEGRRDTRSPAQRRLDAAESIANA
jgi:hypothetical protein